MKFKVSEVKAGMEFQFHGWLIRVTRLEILNPLYEHWKDDPEKHNQYDMTFDILGEGLFHEVIGWSFWHFYSDEEIDTESIPEESEEIFPEDE